MSKQFLRTLILLLMILLSACSDRSPAYQTAIEVDGIKLSVELMHNHLFLAEYRRYVSINNKPAIHLGNDSGGFAHINLFESADYLYLQTMYTHILQYDRRSGISSLLQRPLSESEQQGFIGKFHFIRPMEYQFTPRQQDPEFDPMITKGG